MERAVPYACGVGIVPADEGSRLPACAIEDIELFRGRTPFLLLTIVPGQSISIDQSLFYDNRTIFRYNGHGPAKEQFIS
jgi:hypothetical protein